MNAEHEEMIRRQNRKDNKHFIILTVSIIAALAGLAIGFAKLMTFLIHLK